MKPYVTVAIPFYNAEKYLMDAIKSVFAQTYLNWELILVDDGSTDNSLSIANSIKDNRVSVYSDGKNKKLATRLNEIAHLAKYDFIARMDADDMMAPEKLEIQMKILQENSSLDLVTTGAISVRDDMSYIGHRGDSYNCVSLEDLAYKRKGVLHAALLGRKEWFLRNPYNANLKVAQDFSLWVTAASKSDFNIRGLKEPLYYYREEGNVKASKMLLVFLYERNLFKRHFKGIEKYRLLLTSRVKSLVVRVLTNIGRMDLLLTRRGTAPKSRIVKDKLAKDIDVIRKTSI
tara:strand:- start:795 stop:1661 length:867 start_codon:yes stop_codon:yes gene_type:complete